MSEGFYVLSNEISQELFPHLEHLFFIGLIRRNFKRKNIYHKKKNGFCFVKVPLGSITKKNGTVTI